MNHTSQVKGEYCLTKILSEGKSLGIYRCGRSGCYWAFGFRIDIFVVLEKLPHGRSMDLFHIYGTPIHSIFQVNVINVRDYDSVLAAFFHSLDLALCPTANDFGIQGWVTIRFTEASFEYAGRVLLQMVATGSRETVYGREGEDDIDDCLGALRNKDRGWCRCGMRAEGQGSGHC